MLILAASLIASVQAAKEQVPPPQRGSWDATVLTHFSNAFDADLNDDKTIYLADGECDANGNPIESVKGMPERCIRYGFMGLPFMALNWRTLIAHVLGERTAGTELPYNIEFFHAPGGGDGGGGPAGGGGRRRHLQVPPRARRARRARARRLATAAHGRLAPHGVVPVPLGVRQRAPG